MKESKAYPILEEEDGSCLTSGESMAGVAGYIRDIEHKKAFCIPGLPQTWDELLECLREGEEEEERGEYVEWEDAVLQMRHYRQYGS